MSPALPGTRGLFSVLQDALSKGDHTRVRLNRRVYDVAADFKRWWIPWPIVQHAYMNRFRCLPRTLVTVRYSIAIAADPLAP